MNIAYLFLKLFKQDDRSYLRTRLEIASELNSFKHQIQFRLKALGYYLVDHGHCKSLPIDRMAMNKDQMFFRIPLRQTPKFNLNQFASDVIQDDLSIYLRHKVRTDLRDDGTWFIVDRN
jgi:hypothetical protein